MSEAIAFDSHRFVKNLTSSGFTEAQAEALADEQAHLLDSNLATKADILAVKADIREVRAEIREVRAEIREVKSELELKIEQVRADLEVRIEQVRADLEVKIEQVRADLEVKIERVGGEVQKARVGLSRWMLTGWVTQTGLLATLFWYFSSGPPTP